MKISKLEVKIKGEESGAEVERIAPGITVDSIPGLAVTMVTFGLFEVTHTASGLKVSPARYERMESALLNMSEWGLIGKTYGIDWSQKDPQNDIVKIWGKPFPANTSISIGQWRGICSTANITGEFPWEEESPYDQAEKIIEQMEG